MPLTNRAPVNAAGQIMVTGTTPTPAWPVLGGMTYDPVTGELAVTSAVPNATDPWVGGLRFTNLGALYIVTTIPSPVFYVGGLPVSTLGQLFMSANPPVGSVGGWPIAGDGGVAGIGSGIGPVPIFWAPLLTTLVPTIAGNPAFTFTRATTAYVADNENILRQAQLNESRFQGARRVRNWIVNSRNMSIAPWNVFNATVTFGATGPTGQADANTVTATSAGALVYGQVTGLNAFSGRSSLWVRRRTGTGAVSIRSVDNVTETDITAQLDGTWKRFATSITTAATPLSYITLTVAVSGDQVDAAYAQFEDVSGQSNQAPGEYVSSGVLSSPWHGAGIDATKYFPTTNGNSVAGNIVTEAQGTLIPTATLLGYVAENAATNNVQQSQTFDDVYWTKGNCTATANDAAAPAPDGTITADRFTDDATNSFHRFFHGANVPITNGQPTTFSVYAKAGTLTWMQLDSHDGTSRWANFNLQTGVVGLSGGVTASSIVALPNGWYRCCITWTATAALAEFGIHSIASNVNGAAWTTGFYVGTGQTMYLWGAQVEASSDPSSYIPTTTAAVVRAVDNLQYQAATNLNGAIGTAYAESYLPTAQATNQQYAIAVVTYALQFFNSAGKGLGLYSGSFPITANGRTLGAVNKGASSWSVPNASVCLNGGAVATSPTILAFVDTGPLYIGTTAGINPLQGSIRNVKIYNVRIADADLVVMTQ